MILILHYVNEPAKSKENLLKDATNIQKKLVVKGKENDAKILGEVEFGAYMKGAESKSDSKIHIVAHGNWQQCGHFNAGPLGKFLIDNGLKTRKNIKKITLHTCHSGSLPEGKTDDGARFVHQLASYLAEALDSSHYIEVRGAGGESYTDSTGRNWVLEEGVSVGDIPVAKSAEQEAANMAKFMQPRGSARPRFAVTGGEVYDA